MKQPNDPESVNKLASVAMPLSKLSRKLIGIGKTDDPHHPIRKKMTAREMVAQLFVSNCALCVLSRFAICEHVLHPNQADPNAEFIEAMHCTGASSVMYPVWNAYGVGVGTLASLLLMLRFYVELPIHCKDRASIVHAMRYTIHG